VWQPGGGAHQRGRRAPPLSYALAVRLGLYLTSAVPEGDLRDVVELARAAEDAGFDDLCIGDHVAMGDSRPHWAGPRFPHRRDERFPEPLTLLAAIAAVTARVRLVTCILIAPLRPAALLAKTAATVHALSEGRLVLGVSVSWQQPEYEALGVPFEERGRRLDDQVGACRALWGSSPASFSSPTVSFTDMHCEPRPASADDIPIWFGGHCTPHLVRRVTDWGQGFLPHLDAGTAWEEVGEQTNRIMDAMRAVGRDPSTLEVGARFPPFGKPFRQGLEEDLPAMAAAGVTQLYVPIVAPRTLADARSLVEELARDFEPYRPVPAGPSER
jgi:probable F420-dependent oxidoreductase